MRDVISAGHPMRSDPVIKVRGLTVSYAAKKAVNSISFDVYQGEVFALLGTNGAGKTTTLDILEGYRKPTSGRVSVFGVDPHSARSEISANIGIMLQEGGFFGGLTVAETIRAWRRFTPHAASVSEAMDLVNLTSRARTKVDHLSGGERRKLDLTLAILGKPRLLFLDEPTTGFDPEARRETWQFLKRMVSRGMTVLLTTHYMEEAEFLADRVAIMDRGKIVRQGPVAQVVAEEFSILISLPAASWVTACDIPVLPASRVEVANGKISVITASPQAVLLQLLVWADQNRVTFCGIESRSASLEDVFLEVATSGRVET
ncbi:ABC transporter ATP-binding protein [Streptomyces sp. NPDC048419]|uniref:ABC transporter ATP-binding protein n=1 Tax=Streptomyces sp. NPDC048419 TaxID=3365547 RepID=UPI003716A661